MIFLLMLASEIPRVRGGFLVFEIGVMVWRRNVWRGKRGEKDGGWLD